MSKLYNSSSPSTIESDEDYLLQYMLTRNLFVETLITVQVPVGLPSKVMTLMRMRSEVRSTERKQKTVQRGMAPDSSSPVRVKYDA